ncbi:unnamed protein product [Peniophora sp. CBMAI 1063]|nr:unnamed protein product [Peniophora sp. CBMAI 1063]
MSTKTKVVVLGSGVAGLTAAHVLTDGANADQFDVCIVARDLPEDFHSQAYASPWAGANWSPMNMDERLTGWEKRTVEKWREMEAEGSGLVMYEKSKIYHKGPPPEKLQSNYKAIVGSDYAISPSDLPDDFGVDTVSTFTTNSINPRLYLPALKAELEKRGVIFTRQRVISLDEVCEMAGEGGVVVNATALGARSLLGVEDKKMYPVRGQTILVEAPNIREFMACDEPYGPNNDYLFYFIPRPGSTEALIGGTYQPGNWDVSVNWDTANAMWEKAKRLMDPTCTLSNTTSVCVPLVKAGLGLRRSSEKKTTLVLHSYGFGGAGYQQSWGAAEEGVELLKKALKA